mmetsp:Transcript_4618/g.17432  ORF Transcript_4618/g.17432 Transcript_4618/m.17432 type:complete len:160 (+) Transcript_4618:93-572(+)
MSTDTSKLIEATKSGDLNTVKHLVEECDASPLDTLAENSENAFETAIVNDRVEIVRYFIEEAFLDPSEEHRKKVSPNTHSSELVNYLQSSHFNQFRRYKMKQKNREIRALEQQVQQLRDLAEKRLPAAIHRRGVSLEDQDEIPELKKKEYDEEDKRHDM